MTRKFPGINSSSCYQHNPVRAGWIEGALGFNWGRHHPRRNGSELHRRGGYTAHTPRSRNAARGTGQRRDPLLAARRDVNTERLWDVLRAEPSVHAEFGDLPAAGTPWFQQTEHFHVLNQGERFAIGLSSATVRQLLQSADEPAADSVPPCDCSKSYGRARARPAV